ncbi:MAG: hypothetical protein KY469_18605 [Actinobacteria bacterium]|nr:hypothetical protein [Actinomycetota bacterium]
MIARLVRHPLAAAAVILVLAGVVTVEAVALVSGPAELPDAPPASVDLVEEFAVAVTTFDFRRVEDDVTRILSFGDAGFVDEFRAAMGPDFIDDVRSARRVSLGEITAGPTVQRVLDDRIVFLVVVTQQVASLNEDEEPGEPQLVRVGMLVTVSGDPSPKVTSVQVL